MVDISFRAMYGTVVIGNNYMTHIADTAIPKRPLSVMVAKVKAYRITIGLTLALMKKLTKTSVVPVNRRHNITEMRKRVRCCRHFLLKKISFLVYADWWLDQINLMGGIL